MTKTLNFTKTLSSIVGTSLEALNFKGSRFSIDLNQTELNCKDIKRTSLVKRLKSPGR